MTMAAGRWLARSAARRRSRLIARGATSMMSPVRPMLLRSKLVSNGWFAAIRSANRQGLQCGTNQTLPSIGAMTAFGNVASTQTQAQHGQPIGLPAQLRYTPDIALLAYCREKGLYFIELSPNMLPSVS